jgi:SAM-dependent methyltransferase
LPWFFHVAESEHELQNPTSPEKIRRLGELLRLGPESRVLDVACGRGGPAVILASTFGCRIVGVERSPEFAATARVRTAGLPVEIVEADAAEFPLEPESFDVAMCIGASFVWDGLEGTLAALAPVARGHVVVGEPYWRAEPPADDEGFFTLAGVAERFAAAGLAVVGVLAASDDDWDWYESLHWRALEEWLGANPGDPDAAEIRARHEESRDRYLREQRTALGWAILVGRKAA